MSLFEMMFLGIPKCTQTHSKNKFVFSCPLMVIFTRHANVHFVEHVNYYNIAMVARILALMCSDYCLLIPPSSSSYSPPWNIPDSLSTWNYLVSISFGLFFPGIVPVHISHPISLA
jgi:hypothetical protein